MPLTRIDLPAGKPEDYRAAIGEVVQQALHTALGVPMEERFQVINECGPGGLILDPHYLGVERSAQAIIVQIFLNEGRDTETKRAFYETLADGLHARVGLRREDLVISLVEVRKNDWSFGNGEAQLVASASERSEA